MDKENYMIAAYIIAQESRDPSTQNGAIVVLDNGAAVAGYNHIPDSMPQNYSDRSFKYGHIIHAEHHAILRAASTGIMTYKATLISPWACCINCAGAMLVAGIDRLIVHGPRMDIRSNWDDQIETALGYLKEGGVLVERIECDLPEAPPILVNGKSWQP